MNILAIRMLAKTDNRQLHYRNVFLVKHACDYASLIAPTALMENPNVSVTWRALASGERSDRLPVRSQVYAIVGRTYAGAYMDSLKLCYFVKGFG